MKRVGPIIVIAMSLAACPSEINPQGNENPDPPSKGRAGDACDGDAKRCALGLVCEDNVCVTQSTDSSDAGSASTAVSTDGGVPEGPSSFDDAGSALVSLDGGVEGVDAGGREIIDAGLPPEPIIPWLLSVENSSDTLIKIDTATGNWVPLCLLNVSRTYNSTTFGFEGSVYGSNASGQSLDIIDPCSCTVTEIGPTNWGAIPGITANGDKIETLFGLSTSTDKLVTLDIETGAGTEVGPLGTNFINSGTTWSEDIGGLYSINSNDRSLHNIDFHTGLATPIVMLDITVGAVGIEWHPAEHKLYFCTDPVPVTLSYLYEVNTTDGTTTQIGLLPGRCTNLAAPWTPVACVDEVVVE